MFRASYSILQDELFEHMTEQGFKGFQRGEYGSTAEHLTSLQYQIKQDKERLDKLQQRIEKVQVKYEPARHISKTLGEIEGIGQKTIERLLAELGAQLPMGTRVLMPPAPPPPPSPTINLWD